MMCLQFTGCVGTGTSVFSPIKWAQMAARIPRDGDPMSPQVNAPHAMYSPLPVTCIRSRIAGLPGLGEPTT